jgi:hypothetical protein
MAALYGMCAIQVLGMDKVAILYHVTLETTKIHHFWFITIATKRLKSSYLIPKIVCHDTPRDSIPIREEERKHVERMEGERKYVEHMEGEVGIPWRKELQQSQGPYSMPQPWECSFRHYLSGYLWH